jgi:uncharacterized protein
LDAKQYGSWAVIAGGSEGVGAAFAHKLAAAGINLVLLARKPEPLEQVAKDVRGKFKVSVRTLALDLSANDMLSHIRAVTDDVEVGMVIYNAGAESVIRNFHDRDLANAERMIALNVTGPTRLAHHFGDAMRKRRRGGIIIVGATAGYAGAPRMAMYAAVKSFECILAEGLWYEMSASNVHVLGLILGATRTPAMERMGLRFDDPGFPAADADSVAQEGLDHLGFDPVWHAGGTEPIATHLRTMPRADAIKMIAAGTESLGL